MFLFFLFFKKYLFIYFWLHWVFAAARVWDLVPRPGIEPRPPALGAWSLNHWTTREVPVLFKDMNVCDMLEMSYKSIMNLAFKGLASREICGSKASLPNCKTPQPRPWQPPSKLPGPVEAG